MRRELSAGQFALAMNVPTLLFLGAVLAFPVVYAGYLSLHKVGLAQLRRGEFPFSGWENYERVLEDPLFWIAVKNTLVFTAITVTSEIVLAVAIALLINQAGVWTSRITRFLILLPYAIPPICNGLIWSFLYNFQFGFLNRILFSTGLVQEPVNWAGNPDTALYAVTVPYIWRTLPFAIILVHAALQGIPRELYEQAAIDGANAWHRFSRITLPMLRPVIVVCVVIRAIDAFRTFDIVWTISGGGPARATEVFSIYAYVESFQFLNLGRGSAAAVIGAIIIVIFALALYRVLNRFVEVSR